MSLIGNIEMAAYYDVITWESNVYKNTRSHNRDLLVDTKNYQNLKLPFWVLEPVFADDFFIYQHARSSIVRAIQKMESLMMDKKTTDRVNTLAISDLPSKKIPIRYRPVLQWIGKTLFYWAWVSEPDEEDIEDIEEDTDEDIEEDIEDIYIVTPWELGTTSLTPVQTAMMKRIENNIHQDTKTPRIVWISSSILFHEGGGSEDIPSITSTSSTSSTSSTFDGNDRILDQDVENKNLENIISRILLLLYSKTSEIRWDEPILLPHLKYSFTSLYFKMDRETTTKIAEERTKKAKECFEISQLPYVAEKTRRFCHDHGYFHYNDPGFYGFLKTNVENRNLHHGLSRFTLPWLSFYECCPEDVWQCDRRYLKNMMAEFLVPNNGDTDVDKHYMFVDFETNIYPKAGAVASGYENRIYLCGILQVHLHEGETTTRMKSIWSGSPTDPCRELDLMKSVAESLGSVPGARIFYYSAERGFWKGACQRHGIGMMDPLFRVFDEAYDLLKMVGSCKLLMKNAPNQKLKTLGKAMFQHGITELKFPEEISGGEDSMAVSKILYDRLPPASGSVRLDVDVDIDVEIDGGSGIDDNIVPSLVISKLSEPSKEEMKSFVSRFHQEGLVNLRNKRNIQDIQGIHSGIYSLFMYNQYDCAILYEIFRFLCSISLMD